MPASPSRAVYLTSLLLALPACHTQGTDGGAGREQQKIVATAPLARDTTVYQKYVCQIHARRQVNIRALESGYLEAIRIREGQVVKAGEELFKVVPTIYEAMYAADKADVQLAQSTHPADHVIDG
ncbi:efflux RND transporter periplasmic adaptor subunit [Frigoriglobus tundricola]|uniref:AcrA/AcrE family multidrug resistance protein n=1 Tax=Frigoriglobus tundricola TaxID=2774151 RepID=A0A6M5YQG4_9BACT|nr:biotin/lipoyl-binding protein [Frigoriglobus tundricola]QJW95212.1 AcrA/AcrE family multidrug resistance protein [Frigoriglobus tundricola]